MIGSKISVAVADAKGNKDVSDETAPVAVYEELEILDAEQKGAKTIEATFSEAITALDKLTVSKNGEELKQAYAAKIADDGLSATITLENRITAGTYTVTLTPANGDDKSEAEFEGEVAALGSIEFVSDYLIMKDNEYKEGYAYIKGYDQFGDEMSLSSVTVIPGYGHFRSYDATTGKITIGVDDDETNFAIVKEVPVFVTYQNGADTIPANATLKVTTMSYVQDLTFGDIYKADGSKVDDDTNPLMIGDLKSKPYVEILDVEDQYGNKLSAKDLNDQASGSTKVLFVIPDENTTSAYYSTGKFSTITEKDGTKKTILYLAAGGDMPGSMDLIITGASGQSFSKPVTVQDDPYIDTLRVNYPTLYEGTDESDALEFTAVDQYGKEIKDLFNFAPTVVNDDTLKFNDANHLTGQVTRITAPNGVNWVVKKDNINKKFTVSIKLDPGVKKGDTLVMTAQTAGLKVTPTNLTVGQRTNGESIDTTIGGSLKLDPQNQSFDFNKNVRFLSSNGTVMDRVENEQYPIFLDNDTNDDVDLDAGAIFNTVLNNVTTEKPAFFWTVSLGKEGKVTGNKKDGFNIEASSATSAFDSDGRVDVDELGTANGDGSTITRATAEGTIYNEHKNGTYYVTLYKASRDSSDGLNVAVIDKQSFKLTYSPTIVDNEWQLGKQYTAEVVDEDTKENRNVYAGEGDYVVLRVKAYPNIGEPYYVDNNFIQVTGSTSTIKADPDTLRVTATAAGSATFSVYVKEPGDTKGVYTTVKVTADKTQTATKVQKDFDVWPVDVTWDVTDPDEPVATVSLNSKTGSYFIDSSRTDTEWSADTANGSIVTITNGRMIITGANRLGEMLTLGIKDQHGLNMKDAKFFVDGQPYADFWKTTDSDQNPNNAETHPEAEVEVAKKGYTNSTGKHIIEVRSADDSIIQHYTIELGKTEWWYTKATETTATTVYSEAQLKNAFNANKNDTVELGKDITLTDDFGAGVIETGDKIIVPKEYKLNIAGHTLTVAGNLEISGEVVDIDPAAGTKTTTGKVTGGGTVSAKAGSNYDVNYSDLEDDQSLHVAAGATVKVNKLGGFVYAHDDIVAEEILADAVITLDKDLDISTATGAVPTIAADAKIIVEAEEDDAEAAITLGGGEVAATKDEESGEFVLSDDAAAKATKAAIDAIDLESVELSENATSFVEADMKAAIKALVDSEIDSTNKGYTVAVASVTGGSGACTVAGGNMTATVTITKNDYTRTINNLTVVNPADADYAAAKAAIDAIGLESVELSENATSFVEADMKAAIKALVDSEIDSTNKGYTVAVASVTGGSEACTVVGGNMTATVTITKDGYIRTINNLTVINPSAA